MKPVKKYLKSKPKCQVMFTLPNEAAKFAESVHIVGEFNNWDTSSHPMKRQKNGDWEITVDLDTDRQYQYRFLIDGHKWENDWDADGYIESPFGACFNSVVTV